MSEVSRLPNGCSPMLEPFHAFRAGVAGMWVTLETIDRPGLYAAEGLRVFRRHDSILMPQHPRKRI